MKKNKILSIIVTILMTTTIFGLVNNVKAESNLKIEIIDPVDGSFLGYKDQCEIKAELTCYPDYPDPDRVEFYLDGDLITDDANRNGAEAYYYVFINWENHGCGSHKITAKVIDENGNSSSDSVEITVGIGNLPELDIYDYCKLYDYTEGEKFTGYQHVKYEFRACIDTDSEFKVEFGFDINDDNQVDFWDNRGGEYYESYRYCYREFEYNSQSEIGDHKMKVKARSKEDPDAVSQWSEPVVYSIEENNRPEIKSINKIKKGVKITDIEVVATDEDGDNIYYFLSSDPDIYNNWGYVKENKKSGEKVTFNIEEYGRDVEQLYIGVIDDNGAEGLTSSVQSKTKSLFTPTVQNIISKILTQFQILKNILQNLPALQ